MATIPLSLYIHFPWCISKCPYCDFNSQNLTNKDDITRYVTKLLEDLKYSSMICRRQKVSSIYFGGGTPSLLLPQDVALIIEQAKKYFYIATDIEITLEVNPGTVTLELYQEFKKAGINRISVGSQSFSDENLSIIKRTHNSKQAKEAIEAAKIAGFTKINCDIMFGLPKQNSVKAVEDLRIALNFKLSHISWYQLTLESEFKLAIPQENILWKIQQAGHDFLLQHNLIQYEVSAYAQSELDQSQHNMNYWQYGDYLGIGSGAHSKLTFENFVVKRYIKINNPLKYIIVKDFFEKCEIVPTNKLPLEFMLNALRLYQPITYDLFYQRTGITIDSIMTKLRNAKDFGLITLQDNAILTTEHGKNFLNNLLEFFCE